MEAPRHSHAAGYRLKPSSDTCKRARCQAGKGMTAPRALLKRRHLQLVEPLGCWAVRYADIAGQLKRDREPRQVGVGE